MSVIVYCSLSYYIINILVKIYPLDATFDDKESVPETIATSKRYKQFSGYSIQEVVDKVAADFGTVDYVVHSLGISLDSNDAVGMNHI